MKRPASSNVISSPPGILMGSSKGRPQPRSVTATPRRADPWCPVRPDVGAARPAAGADAARLDVAQPETVRPGVGADRDVMAAMAPDHDAA